MLNQKELYPEMYEMSVGHLFGDVWGRPGLSLRERQYVPGPVSRTHATFGDRCETCHTPFRVPPTRS